MTLKFIFSKQSSRPDIKPLNITVGRYCMDRQALINQLLHIIHQLELQITAIRSVIHRLREHEDNSDDSDVILVDAELVHLVHAQIQQQVREVQKHSRQDPTPTR